MLTHLSWTNYFEIVILLTALYYLFVLIGYYRHDAFALLQSKQDKSEESQLPRALRFEEPANTAVTNNGNKPEERESYLPLLSAETTAVNRALTVCIGKASRKPFAPAVLIQDIKTILREHAASINPTERAGINELIVVECENTGTALLSTIEVNQWWPEP